jgi:hypothetical protein
MFATKIDEWSPRAENNFIHPKLKLKDFIPQNAV